MHLEFDKNNSGEDNKLDEERVPQLDHIWNEQLKTGCEVVFNCGERLSCLDEELEKRVTGFWFSLSFIKLRRSEAQISEISLLESYKNI